jgi:hypothetical protein
MSFNTTDNKKLIWSLLLETNYFKGFPANQKDMVKRVLDSVINELSQNPSINQMEIIDKNREVVKQMVMYRDLWVQDGIIGQQQQPYQHQQHQQQQQYQHQPNQPLPIFDNSVTAEDLREQRNKQFNDSFNQKQTEMNQLLNASKPQEIDFSDASREQKIGGDMERLVAQAEAARKQQMDMLMNGSQTSQQQQAEKWINGGRPLKIDNESKLTIESQNLVASPSKRKVHFSDDNNNRNNMINNNNNNNMINNNNINDNNDDFFAKLKRKSTNQNNKMNDIELMNRIEKLETTLSNMQKNMDKITDLLTSIHNIDKKIKSSNTNTNTENNSNSNNTDIDKT